MRDARVASLKGLQSYTPLRVKMVKSLKSYKCGRIDKFVETGDGHGVESSNCSTDMAAQSDGRFLEAADYVRKGAATDAEHASDAEISRQQPGGEIEQSANSLK
jgi:hypothetical protein